MISHTQYAQLRHIVQAAGIESVLDALEAIELVMERSKEDQCIETDDESSLNRPR